jgi:GntR family transcriptional repressor for pyruvate dehydrogenase complex
VPTPILTYEAVLAEIKRRVADGELRPGDRLPSVRQLAHELAVGTSSVREALRVLAATGVVRIEHGRGVFVNARPPSVAELHARFTHTEMSSLLHLMEARRIIEPELAALAAERASPTQLTRLHDLARRMERNFRAGRDWMDADLGFHRTLADASANPVIAGMLHGVEDLLLDSRRETMRDRAVSERACNYHKLIAAAVADRRPMLARALMREHMEDAVAVLERLHAAEALPTSDSPSRSVDRIEAPA